VRLSVRAGDAQAMEALGARAASGLTAGMVVHLHGPLGAGKTTLIRGMLRALGAGGAVKSPTYTLVEPYTLGDRRLFHFDLYRMRDAEELEFLGIRDYLEGSGICLIEWAERGAGVLPAPDVDVYIEPGEYGRTVHWVAHTDNGATLVGGLTS
jgi:tRNA threonylcarbamoyladenosine biosynthesis protein TsaE